MKEIIVNLNRTDVLNDLEHSSYIEHQAHLNTLTQLGKVDASVETTPTKAIPPSNDKIEAPAQPQPIAKPSPIVTPSNIATAPPVVEKKQPTVKTESLAPTQNMYDKYSAKNALSEIHERTEKDGFEYYIPPPYKEHSLDIENLLKAKKKEFLDDAEKEQT